jgi:transposase
MEKSNEILEKILLPINASWEISDVKVNEVTEEVEVELKYSLPYIDIEGKHYGIYDHRPIRKWRHLDLWQYKTFLSARLPRYKDESGFYHTVDVPWAEPSEQMTVLLEKKF